MNQVQWMELIAGGLIIIGYFTSLEWRLRILQNELLEEKQKIVDANILSKVHSMSDAELDSALASHLSLPDSGAKGKD
jgi:hypothetical protein